MDLSALGSAIRVEALAAQVPGARLRVIEGMGHNLFSPGLPERIADLIAEHTAAR